MMNLLEINQRIKQRPPFQMIERVTELVPNESAKGIKCVSVNEPYFMGHFPETPIMPGVLLIESAAQLCSLVIAPDCAAMAAAGAYEFSAVISADGVVKAKGSMLFTSMDKSAVYG